MMNVDRYKDLPEDIYDKFDEFTDEAYDLFAHKRYDESFLMYENCLEMIPEPKQNYGEASNVVEWMVENYLSIGKINEAITWVERLGDYLKNKHIMGDHEFLKGRVYYEAKIFDKSLENFSIAFEKTKGSCFKEQDKKYLDFFRNPEKYRGNNTLDH